MENRTQVKMPSGKTYWLTPEQKKFKRKTILVTKPVNVYGILGMEVIPEGTRLPVLPLYYDCQGTGLHSDGSVHVLLSRNSTGGTSGCAIPAGYWE